MVTTLGSEARRRRRMELLKYGELLEIFAWKVECSVCLRSIPISS